jgi:general L-amino acid transport system permease protein
MAVYEQQELKSPPSSQVGIQRWLRVNLFSTPVNIALTLASLYLLYTTIPPMLDWLIFSANFNFGEFSFLGFEFGEIMATNDNCGRSAACWPFIYEKFDMFVYGFYPRDLVWRVDIVFAMTAMLFVVVRLARNFRHGSRVLLITFIAFPIVSFYLISGGVFGLEEVKTHQWGGLMLTLVIASVGILVSFPIGVLLALGRQSNLRVINFFSTIYIEFIRAVPLITILFMASFVLPMFFAGGVSFDKLLRALIAITLFQAAYFAEVVRGGLQAIPTGQYEAADAIGLNYVQKNALIILPQALKISIPNLVGSSISLFKDTTLVLIIGLMDMLAMVNMNANDINWLGRETEGFVFVTMTMWIFLYSMSRYSRKLEVRFSTDHKN